MRRTPVPLYRDVDPIESLPADAKVALLEKLERKCRALDPRITQVMASLGGEYEVVLIARADGAISADVRPLVRLSVQVIAEANGRRESGSSGGGGRSDYSHFTDEALERYARQAVSQALTNLEARPAPAGTMTVVLGPAGRAYCCTKPWATVSKAISIARAARRFPDGLASAWLRLA